MSKIKNHLGFTITELLAVIVIIGIIIGIAVPIYTKIRKDNLETQYKNVISLIETKAKEYAASNDTTITTVEELVEAGYLNADDETGIVKNPVDGSALNCNVIKITENNGDYTATFTTETSENSDKTCSSPLETNKINILCNSKSCKNTWFNKDVTLSLDYTNVSELTGVNLTDENVTWTSSTGLNAQGLTYKISLSDAITNATYTATINFDNKKVYTATSTVTIDNELPVVDETLSKMENDNWELSKKYDVVASDRNGSGINGYYSLGTSDTNCPSYYQNSSYPSSYSKYYPGRSYKKPTKSNTVNKYQSSSTLTFTNNGTNYYCVSDKVGNITKKSVYVNRVDREAPNLTSDASFNGSSINVASYSDTGSGLSEVKYYVTSNPSDVNKSYFTSQNSVNTSFSCDVTYYLYTYAIDNLKNESEINKSNSTYYSACPPPPPPVHEYNNDSYSGGSSGGSTSTSSPPVKPQCCLSYAICSALEVTDRVGSNINIDKFLPVNKRR